jgi:hypothetical protein
MRNQNLITTEHFEANQRQTLEGLCTPDPLTARAVNLCALALRGQGQRARLLLEVAVTRSQ